MTDPGVSHEAHVTAGSTPAESVHPNPNDIIGNIKHAFKRDVGSAVKPEEPKSSYSFQKSDLVGKESTGKVVGRDGEKGHGEEDPKVTFSEDLAKQYKQFLNDHVASLLSITNPQILDNDTHRFELRMREALTTNNAPDAEKIDKFLGTTEGWTQATLLIEQQTGLKLFGTGLHAATRPKGERVDQINENTIRLHLDQGLLNKAILDKIWPYLNERVNVTGGRPEDRGIAGMNIVGGLPRDIRRWQSILAQFGGSAIYGAATGGVAAAAAFASSMIATGGDVPAALVAAVSVSAGVLGGGVGALAIPGLMAVRNTLNSGVTIDLRQCSASLESIQKDKNEAAYLKAVLKIDVNNFEVAGPNQIRLRAGEALTPIPLRRIQEEIFQGLYVREQFYTSLGIPKESLDALPEQHLYQYSQGQAEQTGTLWQQRFSEIFQPQTTGIQDTLGNSPLLRNGTPNPAFLAGGATLDFEGNLRRFREARQKLMFETMEGYAVKVLDKTKAEGATTVIDHKITARGENGEELRKRKEEAGKRKDALTKEKESLASPKITVDEYNAAQKTLEQEQQKFEKEFDDAFRAGRNIEAEYKRITDLLRDPANPASVVAKKDVLLATLNAAYSTADAAANAELTASFAATPGVGPLLPQMILERQKDHRARVKELFQPQIEALDQERAELKTQHARLTEIRSAIKAAKRTLSEKSDRIVISAKENLTTVRADYVVLGGWGINDAALRSSSIDELMAQINAANTANPANGWPVGQNNDAANRLQVIHAIAEAKAQYEESFDQIRNDPDMAVGRLVNFTAITGWNLDAAGLKITEDQLRTMPRAQLMILINQANAYAVSIGGADGWPVGGNADPANVNRLNLAVDEARNRMVLRHNAILAERATDLDAGIAGEDKRIEAISLKSETDVLSTIKDLMTRQGHIFEMAYDVASERERFTDITAVDPTDTSFSTTEKAQFEGTVPPIGYWRLMHVLFDYEGKDNRNAYAGKILKTLPPKALARRINEALGVPPGSASFDDINFALKRLNTRLKSRRASKIEVRSLFRDVINGLRDQALAM